MTTNQDKPNRPEWIDKLCEALAEGLEDDRLTKRAYEGLASIADELIYDGAKNVSDDVRHLLPVFLERAVSNTEDENGEPDDSDSDDDLSDKDNEYTTAIATIITDPRTPEYIGKTLCTIMSSILEGRECKIKPRSLADLGELIAIVLEDKSLPDKVKRPFSDAATEVMNQLLTGYEMESAWFRKYFEAAAKREAREA